jgi:plastocyanin domain-containing protein
VELSLEDLILVAEKDTKELKFKKDDSSPIPESSD